MDKVVKIVIFDILILKLIEVSYLWCMIFLWYVDSEVFLLIVGWLFMIKVNIFVNC